MSETVKKMVIPAEVHTDDRVFDIRFDAESWFRKASPEQITALAKCGWGGDYPADVVAEYYNDRLTEISQMFAYLDLISERRTSCGFECHVQEKEARAWLAEHKPEVQLPD